MYVLHLHEFQCIREVSMISCSALGNKSMRKETEESRGHAQDHLKMLAHRQPHLFAITNDPSALREPDCCDRMVSKAG